MVICVCFLLGFSQDLHAARVYFLLHDGYPETCIMPLTDPAEIALARDKAVNGPGMDSWVVVKVAAGSDGINSDYYAFGRPLWSWHVADFFGFAEITAEGCQTPIKFVEYDVNYWANQQTTCFGLGVIEELTELNEYTLLVNKSGTGSGTVTSSVPGLDCGPDCDELYLNGTMVWLTATPASGSAFGNWSGGCSGSGDCAVTMDSDTTVTAIFVALLPPTASFSSSTTSGDAPLIVDFIDTSANNPTSWSWNFGDSETSAAQHPRHMYESAGTYTVSLTASNSSGSDTTTMIDYISASACPNQAVRVVDLGDFDYIQSAYASALAGDTITLEIQGVNFTEDLSFGNNVDVTLSGGNNCEYTERAMGTKIKGSLTIIEGKVTVDNIVLL